MAIFELVPLLSANAWNISCHILVCGQKLRSYSTVSLMSSGCESAMGQETGWACRFQQESENRMSVALCLISWHAPFQLFSVVQGSVDSVLESWHHHGFWFHPGRKIKCKIGSGKSAREKEVCFPGTWESSLRQEPKQWQHWEQRCGRKWHFWEGTKYIKQAHLEYTCEQHKGLLGRGGGQKWVMPNSRKHTEFMACEWVPSGGQ